SAWEAANGSSSEEEEEDEEVVVAPRRQGGMFRVANTATPQNAPTPPVNPAAAKSAVLSEIKGMAGERQAHEEVVTEAASTEKTDAEKKALEARQQLLAAQNAAKAAQAAAIQQAALKAASNQSQQASNQAAEAEAEMRAKQAQAQAMAEAEKKKAEERVAAQRAAQQEALAKAQEAAKKAQADALAKAQAAKQEAEARAKAQQAASQQQKPAAAAAAPPSTQQQTLQQAQLQQQNREQAEAQARAAQAKAQAEAQARAMQAKAQAEADAKARAVASQQQKTAAPAKPAAAAPPPAAAAAKIAAPAKPAAAAPPPAAKTAAPASTPAKTATPAAAANGAAKTGVATANGAPKTMQQAKAVPQVGISLQRMGQEISRVPVQTTRTAQPPPAAETAAPKAPPAQTPPSSIQSVTGQSKGQMTRGNVAFDAQSASNATPVPLGHTQLKTPGKVVVPQLQQPEQQKAPAEKPGQTTLKQTAKVTEEVLGNEQIRTISNTSANRPTMRADGVAGRFVEQQDTPLPLQSVSRGSTLEGAKRWEEERAREAELNNMGQGEVPGGVRLNDDSCWQTQRRVPVEVNAPQIGKIAIPELKETHETQPTVIVRKPAGYEKVKWNEFPEEIQPERQSVPRTKAQEWIPVNNEVSEITRTGFASGKVNKVWPPLAEEIIKDAGEVNRVRCGDDMGWIQQEQQEVIKSVPRTSRISRAWPPPEDERIGGGVQTSHMPVVQWPPPEFEQIEQEKIEVLAKHIPTRKVDRQWPPPPPQYYIPGNENAEAEQSSSAVTTTTTTTTRVVRAM
ncbi:hypothetical protein PMAYCL1PPCAC_29590, partial [Pristionchus mayeri]